MYFRPSTTHYPLPTTHHPLSASSVERRVPVRIGYNFIVQPDVYIVSCERRRSGARSLELFAPLLSVLALSYLNFLLERESVDDTSFLSPAPLPTFPASRFPASLSLPPPQPRPCPFFPRPAILPHASKFALWICRGQVSVQAQGRQMSPVSCLLSSVSCPGCYVHTELACCSETLLYV